MKILSVAVPCYNSAEYMKKCIESLLVGGKDVEILIINDGSTKDNTAEIADYYEQKYPDIVRAIHKENGGHGSAVNAGIQHATGSYFKVVDSDDWVDKESFLKVVELLKSMVSEHRSLDMLISNFIYDKQGSQNKKIMNYLGILPSNTCFGWESVKAFKFNQYILMHSVIYRTSLLRECGLVLPHHTFYVDSIYVYYPLPSVKTMYYLDVNLYHYFIGRDDQSVNEKVMISRIDQQIRVNKILYECHDLTKIQPKQLKRYMYRYLELINIVSSVMLIKEGSKEKLGMKKELWQYMKKTNKKMYLCFRYTRLLGIVVNLPTTVGRKIVLAIYHITQKKIGFN